MAARRGGSPFRRDRILAALGAAAIVALIAFVALEWRSYHERLDSHQEAAIACTGATFTICESALDLLVPAHRSPPPPRRHAEAPLAQHGLLVVHLRAAGLCRYCECFIVVATSHRLNAEV